MTVERNLGRSLNGIPDIYYYIPRKNDPQWGEFLRLEKKYLGHTFKPERIITDGRFRFHPDNNWFLPHLLTDGVSVVACSFFKTHFFPHGLKIGKINNDRIKVTDIATELGVGGSQGLYFVEIGGLVTLENKRGMGFAQALVVEMINDLKKYSERNCSFLEIGEDGSERFLDPANSQLFLVMAAKGVFRDKYQEEWSDLMGRINKTGRKVLDLRPLRQNWANLIGQPRTESRAVVMITKDINLQWLEGCFSLTHGGPIFTAPLTSFLQTFKQKAL